MLFDLKIRLELSRKFGDTCFVTSCSVKLRNLRSSSFSLCAAIQPKPIWLQLSHNLDTCLEISALFYSLIPIYCKSKSPCTLRLPKSHIYKSETHSTPKYYEFTLQTSPAYGGNWFLHGEGYLDVLCCKATHSFSNRSTLLSHLACTRFSHHPFNISGRIFQLWRVPYFHSFSDINWPSLPLSKWTPLGTNRA